MVLQLGCDLCLHRAGQLGDLVELTFQLTDTGSILPRATCWRRARKTIAAAMMT